MMAASSNPEYGYTYLIFRT